MQGKTVIVEPCCRGWTHAPFNAAFLSACAYAYPDHVVEFYAEGQHAEVIRNILGDRVELHGSHVVVRGLQQVVAGPGYFASLARYWGLFRRLAIHDDVSAVLVTSTVKSVAMAIGGLAWCGALKGKRVALVLHGNAGECVGWRSKNPFVRSTDLKASIEFCVRKDVRIIVLEECIRRNLIRALPKWRSAVRVLDHPVWEGGGAMSPPQTRDAVRFGFLGLATTAKGFDDFLKMAVSCQDASLGRSVEFHAIGSWGRDQFSPTLVRRVLRTVPSAQKLPRDDYEAAVRDLDFVVLPYKEDAYSFSASGALLDAIAFGKPIIAPRLPIFCDIFEKYGDIGILYDDVRQLRSIVEALVERRAPVDLDKLARNIARVRADRQPSSLGRQLKEILEN